ncbi:hypothetical protein [Bdellovibrio sp. HCB2-146]|uniref:hypothetical protein n=1 Tax=Bdellovibrio sp. HCB2-146 TaxID=3394362 RepID=UPI0039BCD451
MKSMLLISLAFFVSLAAQAHSGDFFINQSERFQFVRTEKALQNFALSDDCKARIRQLLCVVKEPAEFGKPRTCELGSDAYAPALETIYDLIPPKMQKMFCHLQVIFVEAGESEALAYAGIGNQNGSATALMGIRADLLTQDRSLSEVLSWKEQKAFGIQMPSYSHDPRAAKIQTQVEGSYTALHYVVLHEFGHIFDFANAANDFECKTGETCVRDDQTPEGLRKIVPVPGTWSALSWQNIIEPVTRDNFPLHKELCFYGCNGRGLSIEKMPEFYNQLNSTQFVTTYSAVSSWEDFAESTAFHFLSQSQSFQYRLTDPVMTYFLDRKWYSMQDKRTWIENFYSQDLKYPEIK